MNIIKLLWNKCLYFLRLQSPVKIARKMGVRFTETVGNENCRFLIDPTSAFGSEPYLITIGKHVEITKGSRFITHDGALWVLRENNDMKDCDYFSPIIVGNNVFIGNNTIVLPGVTIGDNVIIGAGSVVNKDIPSGSVCAGVPARVVKSVEEYKEKVLERSVVKTKRMSWTEKEKFLKKMYY